MSIVGYVIFDLGSIGGDPHSLHGGYHCLIGHDRVATNYYSTGLVLFIDQIIPSTFLDLIYLIPRLRVYI